MQAVSFQGDPSALRQSPLHPDKESPTNTPESNAGGQYTPENKGLVKITISEEAKAELSKPAIAQSTQTEPPPTQLPEIVVTAITTRVRDYESYLRSQSTPNTNDYGQIALAIDAYYSQQYASAYQGVAWANARIDLDANLDMTDPKNVERVKEVKDQLASFAYEALTRGSAILNGPGSYDITATEALARLSDVRFRIESGLAPNNAEAAGTWTPGPGTSSTVRLYPDAMDSFFSGTNTPIWAQITTALFHEIGHALLQPELPYPAGTSIEYSEGRAIAMGHGAAELAGGNTGGGYNISAMEYPETDR